MVSSVGTLSIVARLDAAKSASDILYRQNDILDILFYKKIILFSAAGDKTLLPGAIDYIMLHASAALAYERLEMFDEALRQWNLWKERLADAWRALDKNTTGEVITFSI